VKARAAHKIRPNRYRARKATGDYQEIRTFTQRYHIKRTCNCGPLFPGCAVFHDSRSHAGLIDLGHALRSGWVDFWYQPKVELIDKQVIGVEMLARVQHPFHGILAASSFLSSGVETEHLALLSSYAITSALKASRRLSKQGASLPVTINVPVAALHNIPVELLLDRPEGDWAGLIFDVQEEDILGDIQDLSRIADELAACGMKLAADNFGRRLCSLMQSGNMSAMQQQVEEVSRRTLELKTVSIFELKLDRSLVNGCATNRERAAMCKIVIDLVHHIGSRAVAVGLETAADVAALRNMGCDVGQGFYFGRPMPFDQFSERLKARGVTRTSRAF
jgi:EAL domain-containing protein (putative c-di-GMP-specific phosphodiesterase class I)